MMAVGHGGVAMCSNRAKGGSFPSIGVTRGVMWATPVTICNSRVHTMVTDTVELRRVSGVGLHGVIVKLNGTSSSHEEARVGWDSSDTATAWRTTASASRSCPAPLGLPRLVRLGYAHPTVR